MKATGATAYDLVEYPSGAFPWTHPDHLAALARLHGLTPPVLETARVLDIGAGDGMNLMTMAEGLSGATFCAVDLAPTPVARGRAIAAEAGLANVTVRVGDILDPDASDQPPFDYVICHGVYAWTPRPVREALMATLGRVLAPNGVAYVSYNALPGGHLRRILREMMLHEIGHLDEPRARAEAAQRTLRSFAEPSEGDRPALAALRSVAAELSQASLEVRLHDELGECYEPQAFAEVCAAAAAHGLRFLNDAEPGASADGFPGAGVSEERLVHTIQSRDYAQMAFFSRTLFVRDGMQPARTPDLGALADLRLSSSCERTAPGAFRGARETVTLSDPALLSALNAAVDAYPERIRVGDFVGDADRLGAVHHLFTRGIVGLHVSAYPGAATPGERPCASRLSRALLARNEKIIFSLDQRSLSLDAPGARDLLGLLDGGRDRAELETAWAAIDHAPDVTLDAALRRFGRFGLLIG